MDILSTVILLAYTSCSLLLLLYGLNTYVIIHLFLRKRSANAVSDAATEQSYEDRFDSLDCLPVVTTQIPLFNEINVAERVIRAVAAIDYPQAKHEIQILDDSDD
ncbi:MAG TPA: glycosyl transferase family 2, partial [Opitutae bacterium]|nr:glycosyl transferase family 2 [Opitutae bacterium]